MEDGSKDKNSKAKKLKPVIKTEGGESAPLPKSNRPKAEEAAPILTPSEVKDSKPSKFFAIKKEKDEPVSFLRPDRDAVVDAPVEADAHPKTPENEPLAENLSELEVEETVSSIIESREMDLHEEAAQVEPGSQEELQIVADAAFLGNLNEKLDNPDVELTEDAIQEAYEETLSDLEIEDVEEVELPDENEHEALVDIPDYEPLVETAEAPEADEEADPTATASSATSSSGHSHSSASASSSPFTPPVPTPPVPVPPSPSSPYHRARTRGYSGGGGSGGGGGSSHGHSPHAPYGPTNPNVTYNIYNYYERRRKRDVMLGALLGYVVGRRRGRKKTEKRLEPKIDKLEKQVGTLHDSVTEKEYKIRELVIRTAELERAKARDKAEKLAVNRADRIEKATKAKKIESLKEQTHIEKIGALKLQKLEVFRERRLMDGHENSSKRKPVEIMTAPELLEKGKDVVVDNESLVEIYKQGRLELEALREVGKNYLRSGPYEQILLREIKTSEAEIEKHRQRTEELYATSQQQEVGPQESDEPNASTHATANIEQRHLDSTRHDPNTVGEHEDSNKTLWILFGVIITVLLIGAALIFAR